MAAAEEKVSAAEEKVSAAGEKEKEKELSLFYRCRCLLFFLHRRLFLLLFCYHRVVTGVLLHTATQRPEHRRSVLLATIGSSL